MDGEKEGPSTTPTHHTTAPLLFVPLLAACASGPLIHACFCAIVHRIYPDELVIHGVHEGQAMVSGKQSGQRWIASGGVRGYFSLSVSPIDSALQEHLPSGTKV